MQYSVSLYCLSGSIGLLWIMLSKSGICARGVHITAGCGAVYLLCNYQRSTKVFGTTCTNSFNATPDRNALCLNMEVLRLGFRLCRLRSLVTIQCEPLHGRRQMCPHCRLAVCAANGRSFACLYIQVIWMECYLYFLEYCSSVIRLQHQNWLCMVQHIEDNSERETRQHLGLAQKECDRSGRFQYILVQHPTDLIARSPSIFTLYSVLVSHIPSARLLCITVTASSLDLRLRQGCDCHDSIYTLQMPNFFRLQKNPPVVAAITIARELQLDSAIQVAAWVL